MGGGGTRREKKKTRPARALRWRKLGKESVGCSVSSLRLLSLYQLCLSQLLGLGTHGPDPGAEPRALP